ncbi:MAG: DNA oxidative demethylase AlkB [Brevundimonas sp.]|uniref:DNA oxidative demethylase AlkB n=1 Tax=Brevundimonas sp. TaxID=1871086 RepID=UPI0011F8A7F3|nr:DNA oxidative demethylase AlkB [Brevundimonas sp.]RZJ16544.1 MAG: DNA oxidative demethylase AlkB [Brevundimonas sp.]
MKSSAETTPDLFADASAAPTTEWLQDGAVVLRAFALASAAALIEGVAQVAARSPFRHMTTPGGGRLSAVMTSCGAFGWVSDRRGYRYEPGDPESGQPWPDMPDAFRALATTAAAQAGFDGFDPDSCLINRYEPGAKMGLHQDRDERDRGQPIVSVSLGLPVVFQFGGPNRTDPVRKIPLGHGDVVVWGGPARLNWHGVLTLKDGGHLLTGRARLNLTFRRAR